MSFMYNEGWQRAAPVLLLKAAQPVALLPAVTLTRQQAERRAETEAAVAKCLASLSVRRPAPRFADLSMAPMLLARNEARNAVQRVECLVQMCWDWIWAQRVLARRAARTAPAVEVEPVIKIERLPVLVDVDSSYSARAVTADTVRDYAAKKHITFRQARKELKARGLPLSAGQSMLSNRDSQRETPNERAERLNRQVMEAGKRERRAIEEQIRQYRESHPVPTFTLPVLSKCEQQGAEW